MKLIFQKYHGTGNDFILINNLDGSCDALKKSDIIKLCDRHFGIGSDGLILLSKTEEADYWMDFYNPDGSQSFCGNGSRCAFQFAHDLGIIENVASFKAIDGIHEGKFFGGDIAIHMNDVSSSEKVGNDFFLQTGSPHYIKYVDDVDAIDILSQAHQIRYNNRFKTEGTNVNFVKETQEGIKMRTYERGVEDETLSCGTGVTAAALSYALKKQHLSEVRVSTKGGYLKVKFESHNEKFTNIWLIGPAQFVYEGKIEL